MIVPASIRRRWERNQDALDIIEREVWRTVSTFSNRNKGFAVTGRRKDLASLAEKLETGRYKKWSELDDLYACKVIIPTLADEPKTIQFLEKAFQAERIAWRGSTIKFPEVFRFDSTRFVGRLRDTGLADRHEAGRLLFEVQVVTAFEHAWSTTTHALAYKSGGLDWRTKRLAAQLRASVEQLDMLAIGATTAAELLTASRCPELDDQMSLLKGFKAMVTTGLIPEELAPATWSRFAENVYSLLGDRRRSRRDESQSPEPSELVRVCTDKAVAFGIRGFPRLLSLHQFALGCALDSELIKLPISKYTPLLTDELLQVFPRLAGLKGGFDLEI